MKEKIISPIGLGIILVITCFIGTMIWSGISMLEMSTWGVIFFGYMALWIFSTSMLVGHYYGNINPNVISKKKILKIALILPCVLFVMGLLSIPSKAHVNPFQEVSIMSILPGVLAQNLLTAIIVTTIQYLGVLLGVKLGGKLGKEQSNKYFHIELLLFFFLVIMLSAFSIYTYKRCAEEISNFNIHSDSGNGCLGPTISETVM